MESGLIKRGILIFAIIFLFIAGGYIFYCVNAAQTYERANLAYQEKDWANAKNAFRKMQTTYSFSLPNRNEQVENFLSMTNLFQSLEKAKEEKNPKDIHESYQEIKKQFPDVYSDMDLDNEEITFLLDTLNQIYKEENFAQAIDTYRFMERKSLLKNANDIDERFLAQLYYEWSVKLRKNGNYNESIEKLEILNNQYLDYYDKATLKQQLQKTHYLLAIELIDQGESVLAFEELTYILKHWPNTDIALTAKSYYPQTAINYAVVLHENHEFQSEVELLEETQKNYADSPQINTVTTSLIPAYEAYADQLMKYGEYYSATLYYDLALNNTFDENIKARITEKNDKTKAILLTDDGEEGVKIINRIRAEFCSGDFDFPSIIDDVPSTANKAIICPGVNYELPASQIAQSLDELKYIIDITNELEVMESCEYQDDFILDRKQYHVNIDVYDVTLQRFAKTTDFYGSTPKICPYQYTFAVERQYGELSGSEVDYEEVDEWLNKFLP